MSNIVQSHRWYFERIGGFDQVCLRDDQDWRAIAELDTKLWAVLSCPTQQLAMDVRTLTRLDSDADGRLRVSELVRAIQWVCEAINTPSLLSQRQAKLALSDFRPDTALGQSLQTLARKLVGSETDHIRLEQVEVARTLFAQQIVNGDGVITPLVTAHSDLVGAIGDVMQCVGSVVDISGQSGIDAALLDVFEAAVNERLDWLTLGAEAHCLLFGEETIPALLVLESVAAKVDDFFARCALATFDGQAEVALNPHQTVYESMYAGLLHDSVAEIEALPLAKITAHAAISLVDGINPAWMARMQALNQQVLLPLLGDISQLTRAQWRIVLERMAPARAWLEQQAGLSVARLSPARLKEWQQQNWFAQLRQLIEQDLHVAHELAEIESLFQLLLWMRDLDCVVHNVISMRDFYSPTARGSFEAGSLYLDGRSLRLCLVVENIAQHATMAHMSGIFLLYCECVRRHGVDKQNIVAAVTAGNADQLMVGRHGVFYDRNGDEWDAVVVRMIEHPISVSEAFWSPYKRIGRMISTQLEKFASAREKAVESKSLATLTDAAQGSDAKTSQQPSTPFDIAKFAGIFAAIGLAVGALGTALATVVSGLLLLPLWQVPFVFVGVVLLVSGPSMFLAWLKLRKRHLGPVLDANGWAVNTRVSISLPFGATLTQVASLPAGSRRLLLDPFAQRSYTGWWLLAIVIIVILAIAGHWWFAQYGQEVLTQFIPAIVSPAATP